MINIQIYTLLSFVYLLCTILYLVHLVFGVKKIGQIATVITSVAFLGHLATFILRWVETYQLGMGHLPIRGPYECLTFSAGTIILLYLVIERVIKNRNLGAFVLPLAFLLMMYASMSTQVEKQIVPMPEVLQGNYINYHMPSCFIGYAAFAVSFIASILFLVKRKEDDSKAREVSTVIPAREVLDNISYKMIAIGFVMFTILIVTGMFRSRIIWGSYWEWDAVQTWSLVAWLVYAVILHGRFTWKWSGTITALLSIIGFALSVITFLIGAGFLFHSGHIPITG
ncbi:MAG: cytochrome c biogenesis protein CcsA [Deltaproteobacteria bacterium]|nr:cytochrome c biogenesis protein CcsA [Deltaproteobacteria bacterium]